MEIADAREFLKHNHHGRLVPHSATVSAAMLDINSKIEPLTIYTAAAPESTLRYSMPRRRISDYFFPAPGYLLMVFRSSDGKEIRHAAIEHSV